MVFNESLITSAQDLCFRTNNIKTKIDDTRNDPKCRMCKSKDENALIFPRNVTRTNLYLVQKMGLLKFSGTFTFRQTI